MAQYGAGTGTGPRGNDTWATIRYRMTKGHPPSSFTGGKTMQNQLYFLNRYGPAAMGMWRGPTDEMDPNAKGGFKPEKGTWYGVQLPQKGAINKYMAWYDSFRKAGGKHDDALRAFMTQNPGGQFGGTQFDYSFKGLKYYQNRYAENYTKLGINPFETKQYNGAALLSQAGGDLTKAKDLLVQGQSQGTIPIQDPAAWQQAHPELPLPTQYGGTGAPPAAGAGGPTQTPGGPPGPYGEALGPNLGTVPGGVPGGAYQQPAYQPTVQPPLGMPQVTPQQQGAAPGQPGAPGTPAGAPGGAGAPKAQPLPANLTGMLDDMAFRNLRAQYGYPADASGIKALYGPGGKAATGGFMWGGVPQGWGVTQKGTPGGAGTNAGIYGNIMGGIAGMAPGGQGGGQGKGNITDYVSTLPAGGGLPGGGANPWGDLIGAGSELGQKLAGQRRKNQTQFQLGGPRALGGLGGQPKATPY